MLRDGIEDFFAFMGFCAGFIIIAAVGLFALASVFVVLVSRPSCYAVGEKTGLESTWGFWEGCMRKVDGVWMSPSDIIPLYKDGKIVYGPRPVFRIEDVTKD